MLGIGKNLDKYSSRFLGKGRVLGMDLTLSLLVSIAVAVFAFFLQVLRTVDILSAVSILCTIRLQLHYFLSL